MPKQAFLDKVYYRKFGYIRELCDDEHCNDAERLEWIRLACDTMKAYFEKHIFTEELLKQIK